MLSKIDSPLAPSATSSALHHETFEIQVHSPRFIQKSCRGLGLAQAADVKIHAPITAYLAATSRSASHIERDSKYGLRSKFFIFEAEDSTHKADVAR